MADFNADRAAGAGDGRRFGHRSCHRADAGRGRRQGSCLRRGRRRIGRLPRCDSGRRHHGRRRVGRSGGGPAVRRRSGRARRARRAGQQRRHRRADGGDRGYLAGRLAPLHRYRPDRHVPVRPPRGADAEEGRRRRHRQHVVGRGPARLRLPHPLCRRQVGRDRADGKSGARAGAVRHFGQRGPAGHRRRSPDREGDQRPRRAGRRQL